MQLMLLWGDTGPFLAVQTGERLTAICASCQAIWLNGTMIAGTPQCQHREIGVLPVWKAPDPVAAPTAMGLPTDMQDHNAVLSAVINKFAQLLEAGNLPPEELAEHIKTLLEVQQQLEVPHG